MSDTTVVCIEAAESAGTIIIEAPANIGTVIVGDDRVTVVASPPQVIAFESCDQIGTLIIGNEPMTAILDNPEFVIVSDGIAGPPGPAGASEADEVSFDNPTYSNVQAALDALLYVAPRINSFTNNRGTVEKGSSVSSVTLNWTFNKVMTSVTLNGVEIAPGASSTTIEAPFTSDETWTLQASDGTNATSESTSLSFAQKRYYGSSALTTLDSTNIIGLGGSEFASNFNKSVSYDCTGGKYPYLCYPASFGTPSAVTVGGLAFSDFTVATQDFTNASGFVESYHVVRFNGVQTGANISVVWQ